MSAMAPYYQAATLIASPSYPSAIAWSSENLVAVASGHLVTILNPAVLQGPRGLVELRRSDPFPIGVVNREDLFEPCLVPTCLARDSEPCARSISWSQQGFAPNAGCLLAVCTVDGHVKLYRSPICEFCDEWVEVADISQLLFNYYKNINFGEDVGSHSTPQSANTNHTEVLGCTHELQQLLSCRGPGRRKMKPSRVDDYIYDDNQNGLDVLKDADFSLKPCSKSKKKSLKKIVKPGHELAAVNGQHSSQNIKAQLSSNGENKSLPLITGKQYACRDSLLSSLVVAWSPVVSSSDFTCLSRNWCILAVGSKSGNVSFWKMCKPEYYTIDVGMVTRDPMLIGVLQAHKSWVSAISWDVSSEGSSKSSLLLATGCSDGSVKIWSGNIEGLNQCTSAEEVPFALVAEVTTDLSAPVSSISLSVPTQPQHEVNLAIGRVSGSLETWIWNTCSNRIENTSACHAHDQVVTDLSWGLDGHCLYSCSQDNSAHCWIFHENHIEEIPVHTNYPELKDSTDLSEVSDRCFGLTLAPGAQMIALVRSLDPNLLNQMYQARTQKAVVEFIWIGGQFLGIPLDKSIHVCSPQSAILPATNLWWGSNILWSLKKYENGERELVLWDVVTVLQGFKKSAPTFLETLMYKWVSDLFSVDARSHSRHDMMSNASLRKLHLLNIICRKVMLSDQYPDAEKENDATTDLWNNLLVSSERELRERLVSFTFSAVLNRTAYLLKDDSNENSWFPVGVAQMDSWVSLNGEVHNQLKSLRLRIKDLGSRIDSVCEYSVEETCTYCSAPVHFKSPDVAICSGSSPATASTERHKLSRCRTSMRLCSVLQPVWHCVCCGGMVDKLLPETFFTSPASPLDANRDDESLDLSAPAVPLCPFCGILLQRSMPAFLLSPSPV
ncbi:uncharacterized protein LOC133918741 isoform X2 [Phragmites australis]|uniref:uncharacterized protein LOC133918741 isoform X2 n=1 Tax=Phragmites australis TaxID=29695 RepID=UPI002D7A24A4|nr:uncharacterized protein LOC133918741 isoform X2 [Phragmites australis]